MKTYTFTYVNEEGEIKKSVHKSNCLISATKKFYTMAWPRKFEITNVNIIN